MDCPNVNSNIMMRRSTRQYFHYLYNNSRLVCRIMASMNGVFYLSLSTILVYNITCAIYFKDQLISTSKSTNGDVSFGLNYEIPVGLVYRNGAKAIKKSLFSLSFTAMMFFINFRLVMATYHRNLCSISIWLFVYVTHMLYSLSINLWAGVFNDYNSLICLAMLNTLLYLLFISMVALFWMEERCNNRIPMRTNGKVVTISLERMA